MLWSGRGDSCWPRLRPPHDAGRRPDGATSCPDPAPAARLGSHRRGGLGHRRRPDRCRPRRPRRHLAAVVPGAPGGGPVAWSTGPAWPPRDGDGDPTPSVPHRQGQPRCPRTGVHRTDRPGHGGGPGCPRAVRRGDRRVAAAHLRGRRMAAGPSPPLPAGIQRARRVPRRGRRGGGHPVAPSHSVLPVAGAGHLSAGRRRHRPVRRPGGQRLPEDRRGRWYGPPPGGPSGTQLRGHRVRSGPPTG